MTGSWADQLSGAGPHGEQAPVIRVLVADRDDTSRAQLREAIDGAPGLELAGEATDGLATVSVARRVKPDIVLTDIRLPGIDGIEATRRIVSDPDLSARVVVLSTGGSDDHIVEALQSGASGFLIKTTQPAELITAIHATAASIVPLSPAVTRALVRAIVNPPSTMRRQSPALLNGLTRREREVVVLVAEGLKNSEIARRLGMSPATARTHVYRSMTKLGARDRAQLVAFAYRSGLA